MTSSDLKLTVEGIEGLTLANGQEDSVDTSVSSGLEQTNDDEENEFLHSSTFLSNSQIIRTDNLKNTKFENINMLTPTRINDVEKPIPKQQSGSKGHFKLFVPKPIEEATFNSDNEMNESDNDEGEDIENPKITPRSTRNNGASSLRFINLDDPSSTPKLPKMRPETTPWRKLRTQSTYLSKSSNIEPNNSTPHTIPNPMSANFIESLFDGNSIEDSLSPPKSQSLFDNGSSAGSDNVSSTTAHSTHEIEHLRKQITNYKLQHRLLSELIRSIMKSSGSGDDIKNEIMARLEKENDLLINEKFSLQKELKSKSSSSSDADEDKFNEKVKEILELKNDLIATKGLNNELNSYIDDLKSQLGANSDFINGLSKTQAISEHLANDILTLLLNVLDGESATAIIQARDKSNSVETKLKVINLAINEFLEKYDDVYNQCQLNQSQINQSQINPKNIIHKEFSSSATLSTPIPADTQVIMQQKFQASKQIENELKQLLMEQSDSIKSIKSEYNALRSQYEENTHFVDHLKRLLGEKRSKINQLNDKIFDLEGQLEELVEIHQSNNQKKESELLKNRLSIVKTTHAKEIQKYEQEIEALKSKVTNHSNTNINDNKRLNEEISKKSREISNLNKEIGNLSRQLSNKQMTSSKSKVNDNNNDNLKPLLQNIINDYDDLKKEHNQTENELKDAKTALDTNEKEYKAKLEHAAKELNLAVAKQRSLLAEKSKLTFALESTKKEKNNLILTNNSLNDKITRLTYQVSSLSTYELGFTSLYQLQTSYLKNTLRNFSNVLEESSVIQAEQKLRKLFDQNLEFEQVHSVLRSLFAYFENATNSLIEDHSELLMRYNEDRSESLRDEVDKLTEELQWCYANGTFNTGENGEDSPRTILRIEELEKKRKAERERRKQEHDAFTDKIKLLERENQELRQRMSKNYR